MVGARRLFGAGALALTVAACAAVPPDDGAQYYANVSADPAGLIAAEQRLAAAEAGAPAAPRAPATGAPVAAGAFPREADGRINVAAWALAQANPRGTRAYRRAPFGLSGCGRYRDAPEAAQRAFLEAGGPERDPHRLDPDGDGYACGFDPEPYRRLLRAAAAG